MARGEKLNMDAEFGFYADEILYQLRSTNFSNEYHGMNNTERLKLLNEILKILGYYAEYDINGED